jgi:glycosyltransferase involved in cell wall biosynthesis
MKILIINYRYFLSGGPEKYMFAVKELLESHGHEIIVFSVKSKQNKESKYERYFADPIGGEDVTYYEQYKKTPKTMLQMLDRQFYSFHVKKRLEKLIKDTKPDVCYLLHHYNKLSPSVISACKKNKVPVVLRLSDFFLACPSALLYRDGICTECIDHSLLRAVKHRCVKGSLPSSIIKVAAMYFHRLSRIYRKVDYVISPSSFTLNIMKKHFGGKLVHIPSFISTSEPYNPNPGTYVLYVGRVEEEKGILTAIKAVEGTDYLLKIVGKSSTGYDKVIRDYIRERKLKNTELLGAKYGEPLADLYRNARCVVIPARWYENMPNVALEAMSYSRPIIASDLGSLKELVIDGKTGLLFAPEDSLDLRKKIKLIFTTPPPRQKLGENAYRQGISIYSPEQHCSKLITVFDKAIRKV